MEITKKQAIAIGQTWYFTGIPCPHGHIDKRYVKTGICYECKRNRNNKLYSANPELVKARVKASNIKNKDTITIAKKKWVEANKDKVQLIKRRSYEKNIESSRESQRRYHAKMKSDPQYRLHKNISKYIWECLKGNKNRTSWMEFVEFTPEQLKAHLEAKFKPEMNWDNYGTYWHLDHITPISWFDLNTQWSEAWKLSNLQPLEASINSAKCNRYAG